MYKTMMAEHGIGIAANQVGLNLQIFIIESNHEDSEATVSYTHLRAHET